MVNMLLFITLRLILEVLSIDDVIINVSGKVPRELYVYL